MNARRVATSWTTWSGHADVQKPAESGERAHQSRSQLCSYRAGFDAALFLRNRVRPSRTTERAALLAPVGATACSQACERLEYGPPNEEQAPAGRQWHR